MDKDSVKDTLSDIAERKAKLLREAEFYRVGIIRTKAQVNKSLRPEALLHSAFDQAGWVLRSRLDGLLKPGGISLTTVMPFALSVIGFLRKRRLALPALRLAVPALRVAVPVLGVGAGLGALAWYLSRRRQHSLAGSY